MRFRGAAIFQLALQASCFAYADKPPAEPEVTYVSPLGAPPGAELAAEIRGKALDGAYSVWFDGKGLTADPGSVEPLQPEGRKEPSSTPKKNRPDQRLSLKLRIGAAVAPGLYSLRVVTPRGVSGPLTFRVNREPVIAEVETPHDKPESAQRLSGPVVVNGSMGEAGELDYYELAVSEGQQLTFEAYTGGSFDAQLALHELTGSWFDSRRMSRLAFSDEPVSEFSNTDPRLTHRFSKTGRYLVEVGAFLGSASPGSPYQLRIAAPEAAASTRTPETWRERTFQRELGAGWIEALRGRALAPVGDQDRERAGAPATSAGGVAAKVDRSLTDLPDSAASLDQVPEQEPNELRGQARAIRLPALIEGRVARPGDTDCFRFTVRPAQRLAFEIETPEAVPPLFNPLLTVFDDSGLEILTNVHKRIARNDTFYLKTVETRTIYTFERGGDYVLEVRDITSRHGGPGFAYRILVRDQIPHVGELRLLEDRANLRAGEAKKLTIATGQEEGYSGEIAVTAEGLPAGVRLLPATEVKPDHFACPAISWTLH